MTTFKTSETAAKKDVAKLQRAIVDGLEDVKAQDIQVFNTEHLSPLFERVIVASGTSNRQTKAIAASVRDKVKDAGFPKPRTEGEDNGEWIIVDCGAAVAHIMQPTIRQYYRLEELWGELPVRLKLGAAKPVAREAKVPVKTAARRAAKAAEAEGSTPAKKAPARKATASRSGGAQTSATTSSRTVPRTPLKTVVNTTTSSPARAPSVRSTAPASRAVTSKTAGTTGTAGLKTSVKADAKIAARAPVKTTAKTPAKTLSRAPAKAPASSATRTASKAPVKAAPVKTVVVKPRSVAAPVKRSAPAKRAAPTKSAPAKTPVRKAPGRKA